MKKNYVCGVYDSDTRGIETFKTKASKIPDVYFCPVSALYDVIDQGNRGICVSVSITDVCLFLEHYKRARHIYHRDVIYESRKDKSKDGMTIREGFEIAKKKNMLSKFCILNDIDTIKMCVATQSPVVINLPVYKFDTDFWNGITLKGYHAVIITGYDKNGFQIKNSWGYGYGDSGYYTIPYADFGKIREAWCAFI